MSANVPDPRLRLATPASAGVLFVLTMTVGVASVPLAVLARQATGSNLIYHAAVTLMAHPTGAAALWRAIGEVYFVVLVVCLVAAVIQHAFSYHRASGERRQQLKWVASGAAVSLICGLAATELNNTPGFWQIVSDVLVAGIAALPAWAWPSCATGCTRSTGSSPAPWRTPW